jgi:response regulator RpfG family c-di-GMP phosphodiesterase
MPNWLLKENRNNTTILPDAILLDLNMPVMAIFWMNLFISHKKKNLFFIMTSSIDLPILKWQKKYDVIKDYIKKPITANKLELLCKLIE